MIKFLEYGQWREVPSMKELCNLFFPNPADIALGMFRTDPITLEDGTVVDITFAKIKLIEIAIQEHLDKTAQQRGYDNIHTASLRAAYQGPYQTEGLVYAQWMDSCWQYAYQVLADYEAGNIDEPSADYVVNTLPTLTI